MRQTKTSYALLFGFIACLCLAPALATAGKVKAQAGENANFSLYKTYTWLPPRVLTNLGVVENHPGNAVLKEVINRELGQTGLSEVPTDGDLLVQTYILTESSPQLEAVIISEGPGMIYGTPIASMGRYNKEGTLAINLIDRQRKKSAWFAMVNDSLPNKKLSPDEMRSKLDKAARNIFKQYPGRK